MKIKEMSWIFDRLSLLNSFTTPQVQLDDLSFCQVLYQQVMESFLRSEKSQGKSGNMKVETSDHPEIALENSEKANNLHGVI